MKRISNVTRILAVILATVLFTQCTEEDLSSPVIELLGTDPTFLPLGDAYAEPGASAVDPEDGDIQVINIDGTVVTDTVGTYTLLYSATDMAGNTGSATRTVNVFAENSDYAGTYDVEEICSDGMTYNFTVTITASATDANKVLVDNFGDYAEIVEMDLSGDTNGTIAVNDNVGGADFIGDGTLTVGSTGQFDFTVNYTADDGTTALTCDATFIKQ